MPSTAASSSRSPSGRPTTSTTPRVTAARLRYRRRATLGLGRAAGPDRLHRTGARTSTRTGTRTTAQRAHAGEPAVQAGPTIGDQPRLPLRALPVRPGVPPAGFVSRVQPGCEPGLEQVALSGTWPLNNHVGTSSPGTSGRPEMTGNWSVLPASSTAAAAGGAPGRPALREHPRRQPEHRDLAAAGTHGLASVGSASDPFLTEEIRGYRPPRRATRRSRAPCKNVW